MEKKYIPKMVSLAGTSGPTKDGIGKGVWWFLCVDAIEADDNPSDLDKENHIIRSMELVKARFVCAKCRRHWKEHLDSYGDLREAGRKQGFFRIIWAGINKVNTEQGKRIWSYSDARALYTSVNVFCTEDCDEDETPVEVTPDISQQVTSIFFGPTSTPPIRQGIKLTPTPPAEVSKSSSFRLRVG